MARLLFGDSLIEMRKLDANSVDAVVTDPPYGLTFMGKKWDYDVPSVEVWREVLRVLKPGGYLLSFGGTRTYHRMVVNIEDAGFEVRDQIQWLYGSGFPKSLDISKAIDKQAGVEREIITSKPMPDIRGSSVKGEYQPLAKGKPAMLYDVTAPSTDDAKKWSGWGTALKPANEPIVLARKPLSEKTVAENVLKWGTGGLNIDAGRIPSTYSETELKRNFTKGRPGNLKSGWLFKSEKGTEPHATGRFPANIILDQTAAEMLDEQSGVSKSTKLNTVQKARVDLKAKGAEKLRVREDEGYADTGGASRFFYVAKASKRERSAGNTHPTVKPIRLMEYLIRLVTPPKGTVLDPFMGSGTTGVAAKNLKLKFIGIEREKEYSKIAERRIEAAVPE